jgi:hypothetical protein
MAQMNRARNTITGLGLAVLLAACGSESAKTQAKGLGGNQAGGSGGTASTGVAVEGNTGDAGGSSTLSLQGGTSGSGGRTDDAGSGGAGGSASCGTSGMGGCAGAVASGGTVSSGGAGGSGGSAVNLSPDSGTGTGGRAGAVGTDGGADAVGLAGADGGASRDGRIGADVGPETGDGARGSDAGRGDAVIVSTDAGPLAPGGSVTGYGTVMFGANAKNQFVRLQTTMVVPPKPPASGTLFLWPGLDPDGANFLPIDNGVLQPVLTWGPSCAPGKQPSDYSTWWISAQYVNTNGSEPGYIGCYGGDVMSVNVGDTLTMDIQLSGTVWNQTVTDLQTNRTVTFSKDMLGQTQNLAYFVIEEYSSAPVSEVIFTNITLTFGSPDAADCKLSMRGQNDYVSVPVAASDGLTCSIQEIILRAQGIQ